MAQPNPAQQPDPVDQPLAPTDDNTDQEALRTAQEAASKLETVQAPPAKVTKLMRRGPKPPKIDEDQLVAEFGAKLRTVSIGKPNINVNSTLIFDLDVPQPEISELMGEHGYSVVFAGGYIGDGVYIKEAPRKVDAEHRVNEGLKVTLPRFDDTNKDQIERCILPLLGEKDTLLALIRGGLDGTWRLNMTVDISGVLKFYRSQQTFDLATKATTEAEDKAAAEGKDPFAVAD